MTGQQQLRSFEVQSPVKPMMSSDTYAMTAWTEYLTMAIHFLTEGFVYTYSEPPVAASSR